MDPGLPTSAKFVFTPAIVPFLEQPVTTWQGQVFALETPELCHHLHTVSRMKPGEVVVMVDPEGHGAIWMTLTTLSKKACTGVLQDRFAFPPHTMPPVTLLAGLIKEQRWDTLLQKSVELGVHTIQPVISHHTVVKPKDAEKKQHRWQEIVTAAACQSEGSFLPTVQPPQSFRHTLANLPETPYRAIFISRMDAPAGVEITPWMATLPQWLTQWHTESGHGTRLPWLVGVGPEAGWHADEIQAFCDAGFQPFSLGHRILRSETAAMAILSTVMSTACCDANRVSPALLQGVS